MNTALFLTRPTLVQSPDNLPSATLCIFAVAELGSWQSARSGTQVCEVGLVVSRQSCIVRPRIKKTTLMVDREETGRL
jgi:hypothetical protein